MPDYIQHYAACQPTPSKPLYKAFDLVPVEVRNTPPRIHGAQYRILWRATNPSITNLSVKKYMEQNKLRITDPAKALIALLLFQHRYTTNGNIM